MIRDQVGVATDDLTQAETALDLLGNLYQVDQDGCGRITESLAALNDSIAMTTDRINRVEGQLDSMAGSSVQLQETVNTTLDEVCYVHIT